jgi:hypothetical protein
MSYTRVINCIILYGTIVKQESSKIKKFSSWNALESESFRYQLLMYQVASNQIWQQHSTCSYAWHGTKEELFGGKLANCPYAKNYFQIREDFNSMQMAGTYLHAAYFSTVIAEI